MTASDKRSRSRQDDPKFSELAGLGINLYGPAMLLDDDVVTDGQAQPCPFTGRLCRKERVEQLPLHLRRDAGAVVADRDFHAVTKVLGRSSQRRLAVASICFRFALRCRVEAIGDQVEQCPRNLLREKIDLAGGRVKEPF